MAGNVIGTAEAIEDVAVIVCGICWTCFSNLVAFKRCPHLVCRTCYDRIDACPLCKTPKGHSQGKVVNVGSCAIARRDDVASNFGVTREEIAAAANAGRRPADISDDEYEETRNREAIAQAQRTTSDDDTDVEEQTRQTFSLSLRRGASTSRRAYISSDDDN